MIYDADTWIGHWPFQAMPKTSAADLLKQMDKHGIAKALVGSLSGLFYKDAHESNRELVQEIRRHRDRLFPCALLNPGYYGWKDDLRQCREEFGMPVLRMAPDYHGYAFRDALAEQMVAAAHELKMRVAFYQDVVDQRGRHRIDPGRQVNQDELSAFVKKFPKASFLMLNFGAMLGTARMSRPACYYDMATYFGDNGLRLGWEVRKHGADRFLFGSTMLLRYGKPASLAMEKCPLTRTQREAVQWKNLAGLIPEMKA
jgi:hypothetical protein